MIKKKGRKNPFIFGACIAGSVFIVFSLVHGEKITYDTNNEGTTTKTMSASKVSTTSGVTIQEPTVAAVAHVVTPDSVRGIYMTQCVVGTPSFRDKLVKLIDETELNTVVIDVKDYSGKIGYDTDNPKLKSAISKTCGATDIETFIKTLHDKNIYVVGRITVFQDPFYSKEHPELAVKFANPKGAVWKDHKGLSFIDVGAKPYWDYIIELSRESYAKGFDEINYDYVRFPSDGPMENIHFDWAGTKPKQEVLEEFFAYLSKEMKDTTKYPSGKAPVISADLFGMTTTNTDDLNIGQVLERTLPYFDYVMPMVYPSHYPSGFNGWKNPNAEPYDLIHFVLKTAVSRTEATSSVIQILGSESLFAAKIVPATATTATTTKQVESGFYTKPAYDKNKIRPWLQDFSLGTPAYGAAEVRAQIKATNDVGLNSWVLWDAGNTYTRGALQDN